MKRCQPDGRSDVRAFLFPLSWISSLISEIGYLTVEVKQKVSVTPPVQTQRHCPPSPFTLHPYLCISCISPASDCEDGAIRNEVPLKECVMMKSCWVSHCDRVGKVGCEAGQTLTFGMREWKAKEESKLRARSAAALGQPAGLGCKCFPT